jgi:DNA primase
MTDAAGRMLGIRLRSPDGTKFAVKGGKEGLFIPANVGGDPDPQLICEGPTDAAALLDMGFRNVVGRPSCTGGIKLLAELVRQRRTPEVVIVSDGDEPGRVGADRLASVLVAYVPAVRVIAPPAGVKDSRDWLRAGGTRQDVEGAIHAAAVRRLVIRTSVIHARRG